MARFTGNGRKRVTRKTNRFTFQYNRPAEKDLRRVGRSLSIQLEGKRGASTIILNGNAMRTLKKVLAEAGELN